MILYVNRFVIQIVFISCRYSSVGLVDDPFTLTSDENNEVVMTNTPSKSNIKKTR